MAHALAGTALALVGGICGYFGTDFGYHLWSAGRCAASSCILDEAPWWVRAVGILGVSGAYVGLGLLAGLPVLFAVLFEFVVPAIGRFWNN